MPLSQLNKALRVPTRAARWTPMCNFARPRMPENDFATPLFEGRVRRTEKDLEVKDYTKHGYVRARVLQSRIHPEPYEFCVTQTTAEALVEPFGFSSALHDVVLRDWDGTEKKRLQVVPQGVKRHPVTDAVTGLDFRIFDPEETMRILFPVMFERSLYSYGMRMNKGIFQVENDRVWCHWKGPAESLPRFFRINCEQLDVGEKIHWDDVAKPRGLTLIDAEAPPVFCKMKSPSEVEDMMKAGDDVEESPAAAAATPDAKK